MRREYRRLFGGAEFDYAVDFNGYGMMNTALIAYGSAGRKALWLHNDIRADMNRKVDGKKPLLKGLKFNISLYPMYDALVSCGRSVMEVNRKNLATKATYDKFTYAKNTTNADRVRALIDEEDHGSDPVFDVDKKKTNFVTMGRMSTEKNHPALIDAFAAYLKDYPDSALYMIGSGPLQDEIENKIEKLGLRDNVILAGMMYNPFALMKECDCFVLPSIHEGQPMVLLEARQCGIPVIVSNFSTVTDSLIPDGQLLIEPDADSICRGLKAFREGKVPKVDFDVDAYNREAYEEFVRAVCGIPEE